MSETTTQPTIHASIIRLGAESRAWLATPAIVLLAVTAAAHVAILVLLRRFAVITEFGRHAQGVIDTAAGQWRGEHALLDVTGATAAGFPSTPDRAVSGLLIIASLLVITKLIGVVRLADQLLQEVGPSSRRRTMALMIGCAATFSVSLPRRHGSYLGQVPANAWHDPATIASGCLVVLIAMVSIAWLDQPTPRRTIVLTILSGSLLVVQFTPLLGFLVAIVTMCVLRPSWPRVGAAGALLVGVGAMAGLQQVVFSASAPDIVFAPLDAWHAVTPSVGLSLALSTAGILVAMVTFPGVLLASEPWRFAAAASVASIAMFALLDRATSVSADPTFIAGATAWMLVLQVATVAVLAAHWFGVRGGGLDRRGWLVLTAAALHVSAGIAYLGLVIDRGSYIV